MRVVSLENLDSTGPDVTIVPASASGFHAHGYYKTGAHLFVGPHCLGDALDPCNGSYPHDVWGNALRIGGAGTAIGGSQLRRADIDGETGLLLGSVQRAGAQSPWGLNDFWTYNSIVGDMWLAVRRNNDWVYDWGNGGAAGVGGGGFAGDRQRAHYEYYVFDKTEFIDQVLSTGKKHGDLKIQILRVREAKKEESKLGNRIPQPRGGFRRTYYECKIVDFVGSDRSEDL